MARRLFDNIFRFVGITACSLFMVMLFATKSYAAGDLDNILEYDITVNVNDDATLDLVYHIEWMVLDSDSEGPLSWVTIGIPNKHYVEYEPLSSNIKKMSYTSSDGPSLRIDFDRDYYAGEVVSFDYEVIQDYAYDVNSLTDGETVYEFTPGWFDNIIVDNMVIRWNNEKMESWSPSCEFEDGYCVWRAFLDKGEKYTVKVTYKNDAYAFKEKKESSNTVDANIDGSVKGSISTAGKVGQLVGSGIATLYSLFVPSPFIAMIVGLAILSRKMRQRYNRTANFGGEPKIVRTKIEYYANCPGCNAPRPEGKDNCAYCGCSFIKSETKVEEKDIPPEEKEILNKRTDGTYRYSSSPNTYMRVHVIPVPVVHHSSSSSSSHSSSSRSSHHSSCAHSSCACACACACAGGGRAGCTTKDFYNTNLKLRYFENRRSAKNGSKDQSKEYK